MALRAVDCGYLLFPLQATTLRRKSKNGLAQNQNYEIKGVPYSTGR